MIAPPRAARIGVVGRDVPIELVHAQGAEVRRLELHTDADTAEAEEILGRGVDPAATAVLAGILHGRAAELDAIVLCGDSDATLRLYYALRELARVQPERGLPPLHLVDVLHMSRAASIAYSAAEVATFAARLPSWTGVDVSVARCADAIRARDDIRVMLDLLSTLRPAVSGSAFFALRARCDELSAVEARAEVAAAIAAAQIAPAGNGVRVALTGSSQYGGDVVAQIEGCGVVVVADDCPGGSLGLDVGSDEPTLHGLAARYARDGMTPHRGSARDRAAALALRARQAGARAIVSYARRQDDAAIWDLAALREVTSLPVISLRDQEFGELDAALLRDELSRTGVRDA